MQITDCFHRRPSRFGLSANLLPLTVFFLIMLTSCTGTITEEPLESKPEVFESLKRYAKQYILAPGDNIDVFVYRHPEFSKAVMIRFDGNISLPALDEVKAGGLTVSELDQRITELYSTRLLDPEVTVDVVNAREPMVYVFGEVGQPNPVPLRMAKTAAQAISHVGGMLKSAAKDRVAIIRLNEDHQIVSYLVEDENSGQPAFYMSLQNVLLKPDDLIVVPESNRSQFLRNLEDFVTKPLTALNQVLGPYFQFTLIQTINRQQK